MMRDCSYWAYHLELLERLEEFAREIKRQDTICDWQLADAMAHGKAWTDPRTGVTHFPPKEHKANGSR